MESFLTKKGNNTSSSDLKEKEDSKPSAKPVTKSRLDRENEKLAAIETAKETGVNPHWVDGKPIGSKYRHFDSVFQE